MHKYQHEKLKNMKTEKNVSQMKEQVKAPETNTNGYRYMFHLTEKNNL